MESVGSGGDRPVIGVFSNDNIVGADPRMGPADDPMVDVAILNVRSRRQAIRSGKQRHACDGVRKSRSLHARKLHSC